MLCTTPHPAGSLIEDPRCAAGVDIGWQGQAARPCCWKSCRRGWGWGPWRGLCCRQGALQSTTDTMYQVMPGSGLGPRTAMWAAMCRPLTPSRSSRTAGTIEAAQVLLWGCAGPEEGKLHQVERLPDMRWNRYCVTKGTCLTHAQGPSWPMHSRQHTCICIDQVCPAPGT